MYFQLSVLYFAGLIMGGIATGSYFRVPEYAFGIIGSGFVLYSIVVAFFHFLKPTMSRRKS